MKKICSKCMEEKHSNDFYSDKRSRDGLRSVCKKCHYLSGIPSKIKNRKKTNTAQRKAYWNNPEKYRKISKEYNSRNKERLREYNRKWKKEHSQIIREYNLKYKKENKKTIREQVRIYTKKRRLSDPAFRISQSLRTRLGHALNGKIKQSKTFDLLGCSIENLKLHLEEQWTEGMNWDNYGVKGWHIDHIIPCCKFDLTTLEGQRKCFHFSNLQPLWWKDNLIKGKM